MTKRRITVAAVAALAVSGGSAAAIAATTKDEGKARESAILADAAERLDKTPEELRAALAAARDAELDRAVKAGELTQEQADERKRRRAASGSVLGRGPGGPGHHGGRGRGLGHHGGPAREILGDVADDAAKALGLKDDAALFEELREGKTLADVAKAQGKSLASVKAAIKRSATERLATAVKEGDLTDRQRDRILARLDEMVDRFAAGRPGTFGPGGRHHRRG